MAASYRADHVGSLLRPAELLEARSNAAKDPLRLRTLEDLHIRALSALPGLAGYEGLRGCAGVTDLLRHCFAPPATDRKSVV